MTHPPEDQNSTDARLRELLSQAVSDVEPRDLLPQIRNTVYPRNQESLMSNSSSSARWAGGLTSALLAAAVILAVFVVFNPRGVGRDPDPASPTRSVDADSAPVGTKGTSAAYFMSETPAGPRLFREFQEITTSAQDVLDRALVLVQSAPADPDYSTAWAKGSLVSAAVDGDIIRVAISGPALRALPDTTDQAHAAIAIEQVIYTVQAAAQKRLPVQFMLDDQPVDQVYGVATAEPLDNGPMLEVLNLMSVTTPEQGSIQSGQMKISGVGNAFEANITWQIADTDGAVVKQGFTTAQGWMGERLFAWSDTIDVSKLTAGDYVFTASTGDPSGGAEGTGDAIDTKNFTRP